jgi:hypothetical protein
LVRQAFPSCSFREFNPLFNRNRIALQGSGIFGENSTYGGEGLVSGIYNKLSFSGGYTHFETDGWRKNADIDDDIVNVFGQLKLTYKTSFQAEYRYRENKRGDTQLSFFEDDFSPDLRQEDKTKTARLGIRHAFSPGSTLIGNFSYQDTEIQYDDISDLGDNLSPFNLDISLDNDADAFGGELQNLFRSKYIQLVTGAGHFDIDSKVKIKITAEFPVDFVREATEDLDLHHTNVYLYSYIYFPMDVTLTIGASADFFESDVQPDQDEDQFNPKFGITWSPFLGTTLRGAAFRTLKRTLISDQTIEPTQVAGFNQFFDDFNATEAWRYGAAIDQIFSKNIYGGVEISNRDI